MKTPVKKKSTRQKPQKPQKPQGAKASLASDLKRVSVPTGDMKKRSLDTNRQSKDRSSTALAVHLKDKEEPLSHGSPMSLKDEQLKPEATVPHSMLKELVVVEDAQHDSARRAASVVHPFTGWLWSPMIAALAINLSLMSVISNAFRAFRLPRLLFPSH